MQDEGRDAGDEEKDFSCQCWQHLAGCEALRQGLAKVLQKCDAISYGAPLLSSGRWQMPGIHA